ncbi:unnamed protein product [Amoebophrya sp. A25]|nr:unnamed protein product [Amoebophrya sp. A25]|eukprot:GSA25T00005558001.1
MPSSQAGSATSSRLAEKQREEWAYLEQRAEKIRTGEIKPEPGNELDALAAVVAKKLPKLYYGGSAGKGDGGGEQGEDDKLTNVSTSHLLASKVIDDDDVGSEVGSAVGSAVSAASYVSSSITASSIVSSAVRAQPTGGALGDTLGLKKKDKKKKKEKRSKSVGAGNAEILEALREKARNGSYGARRDDSHMIKDVISNDGSYVSAPIVYTEENPPLFDKYFFYSNKIMKNVGRARPPQDGVRTLGKSFTLDELIAKKGGVPEMAKEKTDYKRNYRLREPFLSALFQLPPFFGSNSKRRSRLLLYPEKSSCLNHILISFPFDTRSDVDVDLRNPIIKDLKDVVGKKGILDVAPHNTSLNKSFLKAGTSEVSANVYGHQYLHPMPSMAPRVFGEKHVPFDKLFKNRVKVRRPKDYD